MSEDAPAAVSFRPASLSLGAVGSLVCVLSAAFLVRSYLRHMASGDQAGASLGLMFLVLWLLPAATVPVLMSAGGPASDQERREEGGARWAAWLLSASGWALVAFALLYVAIQVPRSDYAARTMGPDAILYAASHAGLMLGLGGLWIGFGSAARRPGAAPPAWLSPLLLFTAAAALVLDATLLLDGFRHAYPEQDRWALLIRNLLYFCTPSLALAACLVWRAMVLARSRLPA